MLSKGRNNELQFSRNYFLTYHDDAGAVKLEEQLQNGNNKNVAHALKHYPLRQKI
jgi:hypothetical protein